MIGARARLSELEERLQPRLQWERALDELDGMFAAGEAPDPAPEGFLPGRPLAASPSSALDAAARRAGRLYMPWRGKELRAGDGGVNVFATSARVLLKLVWPSYEPERILADRIEAFPFRTWVGESALGGVRVLKIDYDIDANPSFVVRRGLDEIVQVDDGLYLGRAHLRSGGSVRPLGFFALERS